MFMLSYVSMPGLPGIVTLNIIEVLLINYIECVKLMLDNAV